MALSGNYIFYGVNYGVNLVFNWTATQNISANTSTVNWKLYLTGTSSNGLGLFGFGEFKINNSTVYKITRGQPEIDIEEQNRLASLPLNTGIITSGSFTVNHNSAGAGSFTFEGTGDSPYYIVFGPTPFQLEQGIYGSTTFTLDSISRPTKISASNANIGKDTTITVTRYISSYTHTITYKFGTLSGTIVSKSTSTKITWTVPTSFYAEIPNATSGTCTLTCKTYNGNTLIGTTTAKFKASIENASNSPTLSPSIRDINSTVTALTGSVSKLIRYESSVEYSIGATARNGATIKTQSVKNGSVTKTDAAIGVIENVESGTFIFSVTDSRGLTTEQVEERDIVPYVKPTCYQDINTELVGETGAKITLTISGSYYHGSFGAVDNTYSFAIRYTQADGTMGDWVTLPEAMLPEINDNAYSLTVTLNDLAYNKAYEVQSRLTDKLNTVQSSIYKVQVLPVFDWGKDNFNFNVPVNINAETLDIHGETVLRHGETTNNTVLSASGGHIYIRPGGTSNTAGEVRITAQGDIEITGTLKVNGVDIIAALDKAGII